MRNQLLEFNSGSIDEERNFRRPIWIFKSIMRNQGPNWTNWEFNDHLRVKSRKSETRNQNKKAHKAKDALEILTGVQLHKIKSLKPIGDAIRTIAN